MSELNANQFPEVYKQLGISTRKLGCIMLDTEPLQVSDVIPLEELYFSEAMPYAKGVVSEEVPHVTLLYGLMRSGPELQVHVDAVLQGWSAADVVIDHVDFFESTNVDEPYYCLVAKLKVTDTLSEGNARLRFLPHIDTFPTYKPHITLAYINKKANVRDYLIASLNERFAGKSVKVLGVNYGD